MPDRRNVIRCSGLRKAYPLYSGPTEMALDRLGLGWIAQWRRGSDIPLFQALGGIDLTIKRGERVGIVGRNGAGKSTLLKLISGNFAATSGELHVAGKVQALMTTGLGFHPQFTGRENARSALVYNGLTGERLEAALADVAEFAELEQFFDLPMTTYSLGMGTRLQFAVATAIEPDILIVDEVLGAGDDYFSMKSAARMRKLAFSGCTFLLVSHSPQHILQFCERAIWLDRGRVVDDGDAPAVLNAYEATLERAASGTLPHDADVSAYQPDTLADGRKVHRWPGDKGIKFSAVHILAGDAMEERDEVQQGEHVMIEFDVLVETSEPLTCAYFITMWTSDGHRICRVESIEDSFVAAENSVRRIKVDLGKLLINPGHFLLSLSAYSQSAGGSDQKRYDVLHRSIPLHVTGKAEERKFQFEYPDKIFLEALAEKTDSKAAA